MHNTSYKLAHMQVPRSRVHAHSTHTHTQTGWRHTRKGHTYENTHYLNWPKKKASITRTVFDVGEPAAVFPCCIAAGCSPGTRTTRVGLVSALHFRFQPEHFVFFFLHASRQKGTKEDSFTCFFSVTFSFFVFSLYLFLLFKIFSIFLPF